MAKGKSPPAKLDTPAKRTRSSASIATRISQGKMRREARELALHQQMKAKLERAAKAAMLKLAKAAGRRAAKKIAESDPTSPDPATSQQPRLPSTPPTDSSVATAHFFLKYQPFDRSKKTQLTKEVADSVDYRLRLGSERHKIRRIRREAEDACAEEKEDKEDEKEEI